MIKLKSLLTESEEDYPIDSDLWDDWGEYINYFNTDIELEEVKKLIKKYNLKHKIYFKNKIVKLSGSNTELYLSYNSENETFDLIDDIEDWVSSISNSDIAWLEIDEDSLYNNHVESTLKNLEKDPGVAYHYTTEEKFELIKEDSQMVGSYGTGINNRSAYGIFTTVNPEEYQDGVYGDVLLKLDLDKFKTESGLPKLNLSFEPETVEYLIQEYISSVLEIEIRLDHPSDISPYTVIVNHSIPIKYITRMD